LLYNIITISNPNPKGDFRLIRDPLLFLQLPQMLFYAVQVSLILQQSWVVQSLPLLTNSFFIHRISRVNDKGKMDFNFNHLVSESSWFALRGYGDKRLETIWRYPGHFTSFKALSNIHSAPIYVTVPNTQNGYTKKVARAWLVRLEDMEGMLAEDNIDYLAKQLETPNFDAVPKDVLMNNRLELLEEIQESKTFFKELLGNQ